MYGICEKCRNGGGRNGGSCSVRIHYKIEPETVEAHGATWQCNYYNVRYVDQVADFWEHFDAAVKSDDALLWFDEAKRTDERHGEQYIRSPKYIIRADTATEAAGVQAYVQELLADYGLIRAVKWEPNIKVITTFGAIRMRLNLAKSSTLITADQMRARLEWMNESVRLQGWNYTVVKDVDEAMSKVRTSKVRQQIERGFRYTVTYYDPNVRRRQQCSMGDILIAVGANDAVWGGKSKRRSDAKSADDPDVYYSVDYAGGTWIWREP